MKPRPTDPKKRGDLRADVPISAGAKRLIQLRPQWITRVERIIWEGDESPDDLVLESLSIGPNEQLVTLCPLSVLVGGSDGPALLTLETCKVGQAITIKVQNTGTTRRRCAFRLEGMEVS